MFWTLKILKLYIFLNESRQKVVNITCFCELLIITNIYGI